SSSRAESSYERQASTPSPIEMIRNGTRMETRSDRRMLNPLRLRRRRGNRVRFGQVLRHNFVDLCLGVGLHPKLDLLQDALTLHDDPEPAGLLGVGQDQFEVLDVRVARLLAVDRHEAIAGTQVRA